MIASVWYMSGVAQHPENALPRDPLRERRIGSSEGCLSAPTADSVLLSMLELMPKSDAEPALQQKRDLREERALGLCLSSVLSSGLRLTVLPCLYLAVQFPATENHINHTANV